MLPSVIFEAVTVVLPTVEDLMIKEACPLALVTAEAGLMVSVAPLAEATETVFPLKTFDAAS